MLPLTLQHRPQDFDSLQGQPLIKDILRGASKAGKLAQAYLLTGPRGTGKTSTARIIAKAINCEALKEDGNPCSACRICEQVRDGSLIDLIEIDAASHTGVDHIRELIDKARFLPSVARKKVYIIDEVHMLSKGAFNALLKTLEEPPAHVHFILATTEFDKVPATIASRCQIFRFTLLSPEDIIERLSHICREEQIAFDEHALRLIADHAGGGLRDAITTLEKVIRDGEVSLVHVQAILGMGTQEAFSNLYATLLHGDAGQALDILHQLVAESNDVYDLERSWMSYLRGRLVESVRQKSSPLEILSFLDITEQALQSFSSSSIIGLGLEVAVVRSCLSRGKRAASAGDSSQSANTEIVQQPQASSSDPRPAEPQVKSQDQGQDSSAPDASNPVVPITNLAQIQEKWEAFAATFSPLIKPLILASTPQELTTTTLTITINSKTYQERILQRKTHTIIEEGFTSFFGQPMRLAFQLLSTLEEQKKNTIDEALEVFG